MLMKAQIEEAYLILEKRPCIQRSGNVVLLWPDKLGIGSPGF